MIIYIHGFASSGFGGKATLLKEHFKNDIFSPSFSYIPKLAIDTLEQLIEISLLKREKINLIGSSLGGYYCIYLANKYNLKAVLINPAIYPYRTLDKIGLCTNYYDMSRFEVTQNHINDLKSYEIKNIKNQKNFLLLLQKGDEVLDYNHAISFLSEANVFLEEGGNHSFENIQNHFKNIEDFFEK